jgi:hypothetical protein
MQGTAPDPAPDDPPPAYTPRESLSDARASKAPTSSTSSTNTSKADKNISAIVSNKAVQSLLQHSLHAAVDNLFASGTVQQLMDQSVNQVTSFETSTTGTYTADGFDLHKSSPTFRGENGASSPEDDEPESRGSRPRLNRCRVCHQTSSVGVLLGSVWMRTSTLKVEDGSNPSAGKMEVVTSFIFYPSSWLSRIGLGHGTEASLNYSATGGWQFSFAPIRAVPENALIFDLSRRGETKAVQLMLNRGDASVKDTSPKGWSPLHVRHPPSRRLRET